MNILPFFRISHIQFQHHHHHQQQQKTNRPMQAPHIHFLSFSISIYLSIATIHSFLHLHCRKQSKCNGNCNLIKMRNFFTPFFLFLSLPLSALNFFYIYKFTSYAFSSYLSGNTAHTNEKVQVRVRKRHIKWKREFKREVAWRSFFLNEV